MSKRTQKQTRRWVSLLPATLVAFGIVALAVGAVLLAASPGGQQTGSTERPYVGGDLHSLAVDPTDPDKVVVGGHDGGAISTDGGKTWRTVGPIPGGMADRCVNAMDSMMGNGIILVVLLALFLVWSVGLGVVGSLIFWGIRRLSRPHTW